MTKISALPTDSLPTNTDYVVTHDTETTTTKKALISNWQPQYNPYKFNAWRSTAQTPNGSAIVFNTELFDTNNDYDTATGKYTAPISGFYQINVNVGFSVTSAPQDPEVNLKKNGSTVVGYSHFVNMYNGGSNGTTHISILLELTAGDYLQVTGANLAVLVSGSGYNNFSGFLVSRT